jgi:hypothetical protein
VETKEQALQQMTTSEKIMRLAEFDEDKLSEIIRQTKWNGALQIDGFARGCRSQHTRMLPIIEALTADREELMKTLESINHPSMNPEGVAYGAMNLASGAIEASIKRMEEIK